MCPPKVVVLILSYNGKYLLEEAVSSYLDNDYPKFEVVVVDNGSIDGTSEYVAQSFPRVEVVRTERNLGYSGGLNLGLDFAFNHCRADYAVVSNNDVKVDKRAVSELVKVAEKDEQIGFVTGKVYFYERPRLLQTVGFWEDPTKYEIGHIGYEEEDFGQYDEICERHFSDDIYMLVSRGLYMRVGGYDTLFAFQSEQFDWQLRGKKLGYKVMYTPYAKLWHKGSMTIRKGSALQAYYDARNSLLVRLIHETPAAFRGFYWFHLRRRIIRSSLVAIKQGRLSVVLAKWQGLFSALKWGCRNRKFTVNHFVR